MLVNIIPVIRGFTKKYRSLLAMGVAFLLAEVAYAILNLSAMPVYVTYSLHEGRAWGIILSTFLLSEAMCKPAVGALGDRIGRKPLLIAGPAITAVTAYLTIKIHGPYVVYALCGLRLLDGMGSGALVVSALAAIGDIVEEENRSAAMSMINVTYMSGLALGFLFGGLANTIQQSYTASFHVASALFVACVIVMLVFLPRRLGGNHHEHEPVHGGALEVPALEEPTSFKLSYLLRSFHEVPEMIMLACVTFFGMGLLMPIVKLYAMDQLKLTELQFGLAVAPVAACMAVFAVPLGRLGDKYGKCAAVCWGIFGSAVAMWILAIFRSVFLAGLAGVLLGLGFTVAFPAWMALVSSSTEPTRRGEVLGAVGMVQGLAAIIGTVLGSYIYGSDTLSFPRLGVVNYNVPFWFSAIMLSIAAVMSFTWVCRKHACNDITGNITNRQRRLVIAAAIIGSAWLCTWIALRYIRPVAPDRVAWEWVQQLVRGRPDKAVKYATSGGPGEWDGRKISRETARKFHYWRMKRKAKYVVHRAEFTSRDTAEVSVIFTMAREQKTEHILLCKQDSGEWKVCGLNESQ